MHITIVLFIRTIGTFGQNWYISMYQYTCTFTTFCPVHSYHWDTWTEMGRTYTLYSVMHVTTVHSYHWDTWIEMGLTYRITGNFGGELNFAV